ncbi:hypothetical protein FOCC_FOCC007018 [Frankliniella occidentalis]|nr:hypothetical protein FOCC_FOCC007018 [Frankliniella occidentalis]
MASTPLRSHSRAKGTQRMVVRWKQSVKSGDSVYHVVVLLAVASMALALPYGFPLGGYGGYGGGGYGGYGGGYQTGFGSSFSTSLNYNRGGYGYGGYGGSGLGGYGGFLG